SPEGYVIRSLLLACFVQRPPRLPDTLLAEVPEELRRGSTQVPLEVDDAATQDLHRVQRRTEHPVAVLTYEPSNALPSLAVPGATVVVVVHMQGAGWGAPADHAPPSLGCVHSSPLPRFQAVSAVSASLGMGGDTGGARCLPSPPVPRVARFSTTGGLDGG